MLASRDRALVALTTLVVVVALLLGPAGSASAHVRPASLAETPEPLTETRPPTAPSSTAPPSTPASAVSAPPAAAALGLAVVLTLLLGLAIVAPRRTAILALVLVLGVLVVETGVHSVHHLADRQAAADCAVASATAHVHGATQATAPDATWTPTPVGAVAMLAVDCPGSRPSRPDAGRAPPAV